MWIAVGQVAVASGALVGVRLLTEALSPAIYGELALAMTLATLVNQLLLGPLSGATVRFFAPAEESGQIMTFVSVSKQLLFQTSVLVAVLAVALLGGLVITDHQEWVVLAVLTFVFALLSGYGSVIDGMQTAARQRVIVSWHGGLAMWLRFLLAVALVSVLGASSSVAMLGFVIALVVVLASQYMFLRHRILTLARQSRNREKAEEARNWHRQMRDYALPFAVWGIFTWMQLSSDRWALGAFGSTTDVGLYAVVFQLGYYPATLMSGMLMLLAAPILFTRAGDGSDFERVRRAGNLNRRLVWGSIAVTLLASAVAALLHRQIFAILAAPEYGVVSSLLPVMVLSGGIFAAGQLASMPFLMSMQTKRMITPKMATAILGIGCNAVGAWLWGVQGVVVASLVFATMYFVWLYSLDPSRRSAS